MYQCRELLHTGSVKDIYQTNDENTIAFKFSDRYSVFDWGEMPDVIPKKGEALAQMGRLFFSYFKDTPNHFLSYGGANTLFVKKVHVPSNSSNIYQDRPKNTLVPLEVIFRFGLPEGSSFAKRMNHSDFSDDLKEYSGEGFFPKPIIDFSTKLEKIDRYLNYQEAKNTAGLDNKEFSNLKELTQSMALKLKDLFSQMGLVLWDGKFEFAFDCSKDRSFLIVDSIGIDELRISHGTDLLSKEFLRNQYRKTKWFQSLVSFKEKFGNNFKEKMLIEDLTPPVLPHNIIEQASDLYCSLTNSLSEVIEKKKVFPEKPNIDEYFRKYKELI